MIFIDINNKLMRIKG